MDITNTCYYSASDNDYAVGDKQLDLEYHACSYVAACTHFVCVKYHLI